MRKYQRLIEDSMVRNAAALYSVKFFSGVIPLLILPYLARVFGAQGFGVYSIAYAYSIWMSIFIEYGFMLSATRDISAANTDEGRIRSTVIGVQSGRLILVIPCLVVTLVVSSIVPLFQSNPSIIIVAFLFAVFQGFNPLWYFQGTERMILPAFIEIAVRLLSVIGILALVKSPAHVVIALGIHVLAAAIVTIFTSLVMYSRIKSSVRIEISNGVAALRQGAAMFSLRGAISLYTTANVFLLGLFVSPGLVAFFAGAERLARGFASLIGPFSQALFPRVNALLSIDRAKAESLVSKTAIILVVGAAGSSVGLILLAKPLVNIMLGPEFEESVVLFRILVCILPLIAIGNVYGIQWMLPLGIEKTMNVILFTAGVTNIVLVLTFVPAGGSRALSLIVVLVELGVATLICLVLIHRREFPRPRL